MVPHTLVHDKASYMVNGATQTLNTVFAGACEEVGFKSWLGDQLASTGWLCARWGDVYVHETLISHIRRLLATTFSYASFDETPEHFRGRMQKLADHMNSDQFAASGGGGLRGLAREWHWRCQEVVRRQGERLPK